MNALRLCTTTCLIWATLYSQVALREADAGVRFLVAAIGLGITVFVYELPWTRKESE